MKELYKNILSEVRAEHQQNRNIDRTRNSRVLIIDGLNTFIRCWSAIPTMNEDGDHVAGVTGVLKSIGYAIREVKPTRVIVVFDGKGGSASRKKIYGGYKAGRENNKLRVNRQYADMMNDEDERESMKRQFVWLSEMIHHLPMSTMIYDGVEADDVMGYIATQLLKEDEQAVLMSTDKDFLQLVNDKTIVWSPTKKKIYNRQTLKEEYGLESKNMLIYRVLDGDKSDGIPGVKGIGIKTLLKRFPEISGDKSISIEKLLELAEDAKKTSNIKLYDTILNSRKQLLMNQRLMQLHDPVLPGDTKLKIMEVFDEPVNSVSKIDFLKVCMKYKVINNMGDINKWLHTTFGNLVTD